MLERTIYIKKVRLLAVHSGGSRDLDAYLLRLATVWWSQLCESDQLLYSDIHFK